MKRKREDEWSDDELILAIATCPREKQSYSPRHENVIELADLLGRSRGAVSHRFANISHLIHGGTHGEPHVSQRTRELFDEFRGREEELAEKAAEIRASLMANDLTPRIEKRVPKDKAVQLTLDVFAGAAEAGLPRDSVDVYGRDGSFWLGVLVDIGALLVSYPDESLKFISWLGRKFGDGLVRSKGMELAIDGKMQQLADELVSTDAPKLHPTELSPQDRLMLALRLRRDGTLKAWKPKPAHWTALSNMDRGAERRRVGEYLRIDPERLCDTCLLMLKDLVDKSLKRERGKE